MAADRIQFAKDNEKYFDVKSAGIILSPNYLIEIDGLSEQKTISGMKINPNIFVPVKMTLDFRNALAKKIIKNKLDEKVTLKQVEGFITEALTKVDTPKQRDETIKIITQSVNTEGNPGGVKKANEITATDDVGTLFNRFYMFSLLLILTLEDMVNGRINIPNIPCGFSFKEYPMFYFETSKVGAGKKKHRSRSRSRSKSRK